MTSDISRWTQNCHVCHRSKSTRDHLHGTLEHLPVPERPWTDISVDFITGLEKASKYDAIMVVVDRLSKMRHFIPCHTKRSAAATAKLFVDHVWKLHGLPSSVISDRGPQYVSRFWRYLAKRLSISANLSRFYHPQTDSQTERHSPETKSLRPYRSEKVKFLIVPTLPPRLPILAQFWLSHRNVGHKSSRKLQIQGSERTLLATHQDYPSKRCGYTFVPHLGGGHTILSIAARGYLHNLCQIEPASLLFTSTLLLDLNFCEVLHKIN
ncbi:Ribonuclease H-like protein [Ascosphaera apis ARSEF 7405]|uniref:Ribonuclease H-like protein n=1 Tax=Ascosphaera apis ARSEF 7405 TaxID=392613 RepID=A0A168A8H8_9EURO|nr:Ribonuclease H-like protein [Ascosphaera apis ARSEF 7405]